MHMKVLGNDVEKKISVWLINYKHFLFLSLSPSLSSKIYANMVSCIRLV